MLLRATLTQSPCSADTNSQKRAKSCAQCYLRVWTTETQYMCFAHLKYGAGVDLKNNITTQGQVPVAFALVEQRDAVTIIGTAGVQEVLFSLARLFSINMTTPATTPAAQAGNSSGSETEAPDQPPKPVHKSEEKSSRPTRTTRNPDVIIDSEDDSDFWPSTDHVLPNLPPISDSSRAPSTAGTPEKPAKTDAPAHVPPCIERQNDASGDQMHEEKKKEDGTEVTSSSKNESKSETPKKNGRTGTGKGGTKSMGATTAAGKKRASSGQSSAPRKKAAKPKAPARPPASAQSENGNAKKLKKPRKKAPSAKADVEMDESKCSAAEQGQSSVAATVIEHVTPPAKPIKKPLKKDAGPPTALQQIALLNASSRETSQESTPKTTPKGKSAKATKKASKSKAGVKTSPATSPTKPSKTIVKKTKGSENAKEGIKTPAKKKGSKAKADSNEEKKTSAKKKESNGKKKPSAKASAKKGKDPEDGVAEEPDTTAVIQEELEKDVASPSRKALGFLACSSRDASTTSLLMHAVSQLGGYSIGDASDGHQLSGYIIGEETRRGWGILYAKTRKVPLLSDSWLSASISAGAWQPMEDFYSTTFGPMLEKSNVPLLHGMRIKVAVKGSDASIMKKIITAAGARVAETRFDVVISDEEKAANSEKNVSKKWLADSIDKGCRLDVSSYSAAV